MTTGADRAIVSEFVPAHPGNWEKGRGRFGKPRAIVLHTMAGFLSGTDSWFQDPRANVSTHYGVGLRPRGGTGPFAQLAEVHQYVRERDRAFHAGNAQNSRAKLVREIAASPNLWTVGIEHEDERNPYIRRPDAQVLATAELVARICLGHDIPCDKDHVLRHSDVRPAKPDCPGSLPVERIIDLAGALIERYRGGRAGLAGDE